MATETATDVVMPQMGVSVSEGTVTKWLKQEGETIEADEPLLEISTDKVDTEIPSPASGVVTQILVQEGETVEVGTKLAQIGGAAAGTQIGGAAAGTQIGGAAAGTQIGGPAGGAQPEAEAPEAATRLPEAPPESASPAAATEPAASEPAVSPAQPSSPSDNGKAFVSPVVARIAAEHGVDPGQVPGTGRGGRVTKKDILDFIDNPPAAPAGTAATPPKTEEAPPSAPQASPPSPATPASPQPQAGEQLEPVTAMRRGIAEHMRRSLDTAAHVTSAIEVDLSRVVAARKTLKKEYEASYGVNPTFLAFVARATVLTLKDYPYVNAELRGDSIVTRNYVNLGFAVELADGKGLIVPVLRNAETMNLLGIAKGIADLAARSRNKKLLPEDVQGGTFTITNPGGYGTFHGTPVINQPQSAILGTYALVKRAVVIQDAHGDDVIAIRPMMNITLTYDHRLVDGAYAGRFLRDLRARLEAWEGDGG